jgi:hypothetical protein
LTNFHRARRNMIKDIVVNPLQNSLAFGRISFKTQNVSDDVGPLIGFEDDVGH